MTHGFSDNSVSLYNYNHFGDPFIPDIKTTLGTCHRLQKAKLVRTFKGTKKSPKPSMATDWRGTKSVTGCLEALCLTERMADVTFSFPGSVERVHAHKFVLSLRSEVFEAMFYGPMAEQGQVIRIEDSDPESFKLFLKYVYSDATDFKGPTVMMCLYLGRKYCVESLVRACSLYLQTSISGDNVCTIYEQAEHFAMPELQEKCLLFMANNSEDVFKSEEFFSISCEFLAQFFARDEINVKEESVFEAAVTWAKCQCANSGEDESPENLRRQLGDAFYRIRLPTLSFDTFAEVIGASGLLSYDEGIHLYRYIASGSDNTNPVSKIVGRFQAEKRKPKTVKIVLSCDPSPCTTTPLEIRLQKPSNTNNVQITVVSSLQLKLMSVSGDIFDKGIEAVQLNYTALVHEDQWLIKDQRLELVDGVLLQKDVPNVLMLMLKQKILKESSHIQAFDTLGANGTISYPTYTNCKCDCIVLSTNE